MGSQPARPLCLSAPPVALSSEGPRADRDDFGQHPVLGKDLVQPADRSPDRSLVRHRRRAAASRPADARIDRRARPRVGPANPLARRSPRASVGQHARPLPSVLPADRRHRPCSGDHAGAARGRAGSLRSGGRALAGEDAVREGLGRSAETRSAGRQRVPHDQSFPSPGRRHRAIGQTAYANLRLVAAPRVDGPSTQPREG